MNAPHPLITLALNLIAGTTDFTGLGVRLLFESRLAGKRLASLRPPEFLPRAVRSMQKLILRFGSAAASGVVKRENFTSFSPS